MPTKIRQQTLDRVLAHATRSLPTQRVEKTNLYLDEKVFEKGAIIGPPRQKIVAEIPTILVFADDEPQANFGHACRYLLYDANTGELHREIKAQLPPFMPEQPRVLRAFHQPVRFAPESIRLPLRPFYHCPILLPAYERYALLYSGMSNKRHLNDLEFLYRTLVDIYHFKPANILVCHYDGTLNTQDGVQVNWPGDNTPYRIQITGTGTQASLEAAMDSLKQKLKKNDLLLIHANNHGGYDGTPGTANLCTYPNWTGYYANDFANKLSQLPAFGQLIVMLEQCHSGGFNAPILAKTTAANTSIGSACIETQNSYVSADGNWDPYARDWIAAQAGHDCFGGALPHSADTNGDGKIQAKEAHDFADSIHHPLDTPVFSQSSQAGADISLGSKYKVWWWWCVIWHKYLEAPHLKLRSDEFHKKLGELQPEMARLAAELDEKSEILKKELDSKVKQLVEKAFR